MPAQPCAVRREGGQREKKRTLPTKVVGGGRRRRRWLSTAAARAPWPRHPLWWTGAGTAQAATAMHRNGRRATAPRRGAGEGQTQSTSGSRRRAGRSGGGGKPPRTAACPGLSPLPMLRTPPNAAGGKRTSGRHGRGATGDDPQERARGRLTGEALRRSRPLAARPTRQARALRTRRRRRIKAEPVTGRITIQVRTQETVTDMDSDPSTTFIEPL